MNPVENAVFGMEPLFGKEFKGVSKCYGCGKWSAFPELMFCQGSGHQTRRSRCSENIVIDQDGKECLNVLRRKYDDATLAEARYWFEAVKSASATQRGNRSSVLSTPL